MAMSNAASSQPDAPSARHPLVAAVAKALRGRCGLREAFKREQPRGGPSMLVGVSGGADSVALLRALDLLRQRRGFAMRLTVAHVQHHLREEAEADAAFVASLAASLDLPFARRDIDVPDRGNTEANARRLRYRALSGMARDAGARHVAVAHHADDQLETLLMRLLRGGSVRGLSGMAWRRPLHEPLHEPVDAPRESNGDAADGHASGEAPWLIRPMLGVEAADARAFLEAMQQDWREDASNDNRSLRRNRLRAEVLPVLRELQPDAASKAVRLGEHLREVAGVLDGAIDDALTAARLPREAKADDGCAVGDSHPVTLSRAMLRALPEPVLMGLLRRVLRGNATNEEHAPGGDGGDISDRLGVRALSPLCLAICDGQGGERGFDFAGAKALVTADVVRLVTH